MTVKEINYNIDEAIDDAFGDAREYLLPFDLDLAINRDYSFGNNNWVAAYEGGSVHTGTISIAVNKKAVVKWVKKLEKRYGDNHYLDDDIFAQVMISIYHEIGHALIELIDYYYEQDEQTYELLSKNKQWLTIKNGDEEQIVEKFGESFSDLTEVRAKDSILRQFILWYTNFVDLQIQEEGHEGIEKSDSEIFFSNYAENRPNSAIKRLNSAKLNEVRYIDTDYQYGDGTKKAHKKDWEQVYQQEPIKNDETIRVYHGCNLKNALMFAKEGLSGRQRQPRRFSYEMGMNPNGLFVTTSFYKAKDFANPFDSGAKEKEAAVIIEFSVKVKDLDTPVWNGQDTYFGQMSNPQPFSDKESRDKQKSKYNDNARKSEYEYVRNSDNPALASSIFDNNEHQALFIGDLNPNMIKRFWVKTYGRDFCATSRDFIPMKREQFLKEFGNQEFYVNTDRDGKEVYSNLTSYKLFNPNEEFKGYEDMAKRYLNRRKKLYPKAYEKELEREGSEENIIKDYTKEWQDCLKYQEYEFLSQFMWPKQLRKLLGDSEYQRVFDKYGIAMNNEAKTYKKKGILNEGAESRNMSAAKHYLYDKRGCNEQEALKIIGAIKTDIPNVRLAKCKFLLGVTRMYIDGELSNGGVIMNLNKTLKLIASDAHVNEYNQDLNGMPCNELIQRFKGAVQQELQQAKDNLSQEQYTENSDYQIVKIDTPEEAAKYGKYTSWCVTHGEEMYDSYTSERLGRFYFCLKNGFENVPQQRGENCPLDEYGLSMIAVSVSIDGSCNTVTCRWNHDNGGNDHIMTDKELSQLIGRNFYETFLPKTREELEATGKFKNGWCKQERYNEDLEETEYNFVNLDGKLISDIWLDDVKDFKDGLALVNRKNKYNFITTDGNFFLDHWYDQLSEFNDGYALIKFGIQDYNFMNREKGLLSPKNFEYATKFNNGYAHVEVEGKGMNCINTKGQFISKQWFKFISGCFCQGVAYVVNFDDKANCIDTNGNIVLNQWYDEVDPINNEGWFRISEERLYNYINMKNELLFDVWCENRATARWKYDEWKNQQFKKGQK